MDCVCHDSPGELSSGHLAGWSTVQGLALCAWIFVVYLAIRRNLKLYKVTRTPLGKAQVNVLVKVAYSCSLPYSLCRLAQVLIHIAVYLGQEETLCSASQDAGRAITILGVVAWISQVGMLLGIAFYLEAVRRAFNRSNDSKPSWSSLEPWRNEQIRVVFFVTLAVACGLSIVNASNCMGEVNMAFEAAFMSWGIVLVLVGLMVWYTSYALVSASAMGAAKFWPMIRMAGTAFTSSLLLGALFLLVSLNKSLEFRDIAAWLLIIRGAQTCIEVWLLVVILRLIRLQRPKEEERGKSIANASIAIDAAGNKHTRSSHAETDSHGSSPSFISTFRSFGSRMSAMFTGENIRQTGSWFNRESNNARTSTAATTTTKEPKPAPQKERPQSRTQASVREDDFRRGRPAEMEFFRETLGGMVMDDDLEMELADLRRSSGEKPRSGREDDARTSTSIAVEL